MQQRDVWQLVLQIYLSGTVNCLAPLRCHPFCAALRLGYVGKQTASHEGRMGACGI